MVCVKRSKLWVEIMQINISGQHNNIKDVKQRAKKIKLLVMDVDGVLTPGYMVIADSGKEIKIFDVHDGFGVMLWKKAGLLSAIITAGKAPAITHRAECLKIDKVYQNTKDKLMAYNRLKKYFNINDEQVCFIGDDLIDMPVLKRVGLSCLVAGGHKDIHACTHYRCRLPGGRGAVREVIDMILKAKGIWGNLTRDYFK
jgi:3-deoxy-D-manno-octulosonate 8-phosphate phosphatase (KDO 8-P phosphatase)